MPASATSTMSGGGPTPVLYIMGHGFSGSTLLSLLLGAIRR
jgi:hypothetical protein